MARAVFVGGTGSNVGKSWMATALCRLLSRRGLRVAPFKAQNMSNNSFPCREGGEIGRSQVAQAQACRREPCAAMNPVLLKPAGDSRSQVILHGAVWRTVHARDYGQHVAFLQEEARRAYRALATGCDVVVMEGAGSVAEINLWDRDFTNLSMAQYAGARALLVAGIERGGIFASLLGTLDLLPPSYRTLVRAFAVNRFRGDRALFDEGAAMLEKRAGIPCLGVFPYAHGLRLDAEDSLSDLAGGASVGGGDASGVAIIRFPQISNTTDFALLPGAVWLERPPGRSFRAVILPGTKSTLASLAWLRESGLAGWILEQHEAGASIFGICGGYQMLGERIDDPLGVDGDPGSARGLGLLPVRTVMEAHKTTRTRRARTATGTRFEAYEIHMGRTEAMEPVEPFAFFEDGAPEGVTRGQVRGTYLHGALESPELVAELFSITSTPPDRERHYDALADWLEANASPSVLAELLGA
ncbi:MAG: cobyric acid synthase [Bryobacterales bacterium]|nr:cobyric acid synthase [Bryobacterales bacterium]